MRMFESCRPRQPVNRTLILAWQSIGVTTCVGFIIGFPHDTPETVRHDIEIVKRELPADLVEFFVLTPVPGSEDGLGIALQRQAASLSRNGTWSIKK
jgi:hypothetical protein